MNRATSRRGLVLAIALWGGMVQASAPDTTLPPAARAAEAAKAFSSELRATLGTAMAEGGPTAGVAVCHDEAPRIAERIATTHGVRLGRVGVRSRQPANRLPGWQKDILQQWQDAPPAGPPARWAPVATADADTGTVRWAKAIETEAVCAVCHGASIEPGLAATIQRLYPDDPATGFAPGSLRGLLWVEVPSAGSATSPTPDARQTIRMSPAQAAALRRQMRAHLVQIEGLLLAVGHDDGPGAAAVLGQKAAGGGGAEGDDFRTALPEGWSRFARPMNAALDQAAEAASAGELARSLRHAGEAVGQCNACHATYRVEAGVR